MKSFKGYIHNITEASLAGKSRSGGMSNWDYYIVPNWKKSDGYIYSLEGDTPLYASPTSKEAKGKYKKGTKIKILSKKLKESGKSKFAHVAIDGNKGYVNISKIKKPSGKGQEGVIGGGKNSKEFTPDKMNLGGEEFSSASDLVSTVGRRLKSSYGGKEYKEIHRYLGEFVKLISGETLTEGKVARFQRVYKTKKKFNIASSDIKILSKNFGEVLGALYILKTNKKMKVVGFPGAMNEGLYDFYGRDKNGRVHYYSVKAAGGSSTSLNNINFIKKHFSENNTFVQQRMDELKAIDRLINYPGKNTVDNILDFFQSEFPGKTKQIRKIMGASAKLKTLSKAGLVGWIRKSRDHSADDYHKALEKVYSEVLGDLGQSPKASHKALSDMFDNPTDKEYDGGFLVYPLGSYIVKYLNSKQEYVDALNMLVGHGNFVSQVTVDMTQKETTIQIIKFSKNQFRFSYNGGSKYPGNRPIGFKEI